MIARMKHTLAAAAMMLLALPALAQSTEDRLGVPGPVLFQNKSYELKWSSQPSPTYYKQEYVPADQAVETFTDMFLIEALTQPMRAIDSASAQIRMLNGRKGTDPVVNYNIFRNEKTGEVLLDFLISDMKANPIVVEWNAYRYAPRQGGDGVVLYAVSRRGYGEADAKALLQGLKSWRVGIINALASFKAPPVTVAK